MKYIVITAKHHDGFAMFHSQAERLQHRRRHALQARSAEGTRGGLQEARHQARLLLLAMPGLASSRAAKPADGHWDKAQEGSFDDYLDKIAIPQVTRTADPLRPGGGALVGYAYGEMTPDAGRMCNDLLKLQPGIITNNRLGGGFAGDTETPEQTSPPPAIRAAIGNRA